jgi:hypothetical protein
MKILRKCMWEDNITIDRKETGLVCIDLMHLAEDED